MSETTEREVRVPSELVEMDIIGKEFKGIEFKSDGTLYYKKEHESSVGEVGIVKLVNPSYNKKYTLIDFTNGISLHYYTEDVLDQLKKQLQDPKYLSGLYKDVFTILLKISKL